MGSMQWRRLATVMVLMAILAIFSGCVGKKKLTQEEEEFWAHVMKSSEYIEQRTKLWEEAKEANNRGDYDKAEQLFKKMVEYDKSAIKEVEIAINITDNPKLKNWAEYMKKSAEYGMLADQKLVEMVQHSKKGDESLAEIALREHNEYAKKAKEMLKKAKELERRGLR